MVSASFYDSFVLGLLHNETLKDWNDNYDKWCRIIVTTIWWNNCVCAACDEI